MVRLPSEPKDSNQVSFTYSYQKRQTDEMTAKKIIVLKTNRFLSIRFAQSDEQTESTNTIDQ